MDSTLYVPTGLMFIFGDLKMTPVRRTLLKGGAAVGALMAAPTWLHAQTTSAERRFSPEAGTWRTFDVTTKVEIAEPQGVTRVWLPIPSVDSPWQRSLETRFSTNGQARMGSDLVEGAKFLSVTFAEGVRPVVEITSRVQTQNRAAELSARNAEPEAADTLRHFTRATQMLPLDGIVRTTALSATKGAKTDEQKARAIYDWVVTNAFRDPKTRGCGEGDIKAMLETGNLGGKCADLNALFVGLCRAVGLPARDVYGIRLAPSAFGYKELSGNPSSLKGAQHCRAEVYLQAHGWVAADPADVAKVMRLETAEWIKKTDHPVVAPVYKHLWGGWEGNWMAWNTAHDVRLPGSQGGLANFLMYPLAETAEGRLDSYAPDAFKYAISAIEVKA
jgi:transglutaminase-like putative cysteine protease